eukprot:g2019.t1
MSKTKNENLHVPVSLLVDRTVDVTYEELNNLKTQLRGIDSASRKARLERFLGGTRVRLLRLIALLRWAKSDAATAAKNSDALLAASMRPSTVLAQSISFAQELKGINNVAKAAAFDVSNSLAVLSTGKMPLPSIIRNCLDIEERKEDGQNTNDTDDGPPKKKRRKVESVNYDENWVKNEMAHRICKRALAGYRNIGNKIVPCGPFMGAISKIERTENCTRLLCKRKSEYEVYLSLVTDSAKAIAAAETAAATAVAVAVTAAENAKKEGADDAARAHAKRMKEAADKAKERAQYVVSSKWKVSGLRIFVGPMIRTPELILSHEQLTFLTDLLQNHLRTRSNSFALHRTLTRSSGEGEKNREESTDENPLIICHTLLHDFCASLQLRVLHMQIRQLTAQGALRGVVCQLNLDKQCLEIWYWGSREQKKKGESPGIGKVHISLNRATNRLHAEVNEIVSSISKSSQIEIVPNDIDLSKMIFMARAAHALQILTLLAERIFVQVNYGGTIYGASAKAAMKKAVQMATDDKYSTAAQGPALHLGTIVEGETSTCTLLVYLDLETGQLCLRETTTSGFSNSLLSAFNKTEDPRSNHNLFSETENSARRALQSALSSSSNDDINHRFVKVSNILIEAVEVQRLQQIRQLFIKLVKRFGGQCIERKLPFSSNFKQVRSIEMKTDNDGEDKLMLTMIPSQKRIDEKMVIQAPPRVGVLIRFFSRKLIKFHTLVLHVSTGKGLVVSAMNDLNIDFTWGSDEFSMYEEVQRAITQSFVEARRHAPLLGLKAGLVDLGLRLSEEKENGSNSSFLLHKLNETGMETKGKLFVKHGRNHSSIVCSTNLQYDAIDGKVLSKAMMKRSGFDGILRFGENEDDYTSYQELLLNLQWSRIVLHCGIQAMHQNVFQIPVKWGLQEAKIVAFTPSSIDVAIIVRGWNSFDSKASTSFEVLYRLEQGFDNNRLDNDNDGTLAMACSKSVDIPSTENKLDGIQGLMRLFVSVKSKENTRGARQKQRKLFLNHFVENTTQILAPRILTHFSCSRPTSYLHMLLRSCFAACCAADIEVSLSKHDKTSLTFSASSPANLKIEVSHNYGIQRSAFEVICSTKGRACVYVANLSSRSHCILEAKDVLQGGLSKYITTQSNKK